MGDTIAEEFISKFHSLSGTTIKERTKNLYVLLNKTRNSLQHSKFAGKINLAALVPKTPLEESFKVTALIHFRCAHELLDVLKSENPLLLDRVFKHSSWILKQTFIDITPEYLATQLFPNISYNSKIKLLNHLSYHLNDTHTADAYFDAIREHYGYYLASKLLSSCSSDLILKCIKLYKTEITPRQLMLIIKKYPHLTEILFEMLDRQNAKLQTGVKYNSVFKYISKNDFALFLKLYEKYTPDIHLGPKETDSFIKTAVKSNALKSCVKLDSILKTKQIGKSMGSDFKEFYFLTFPKRICQVVDNLTDNYKLLRHLSNLEKLKMFSSTFQKIYGNEVWEYPDILQQGKLIEWMSPDERTLWIERHSRPSDISEETWISYYKTEKSIPLLKEKILLTSSVKARSKYILALLRTCKVNKDDFALLDVLKYINLKHRNDNNIIIQEFLLTFNELYKENHLIEAHWNEIYQCIQLFILNNGYNYYNRDILEKCVHYRLSHNLSVKDILEYWAKQYPGEYDLFRKKQKFEKHCLTEFQALIPLGYKNDDLHKGYIKYLYYVNQYNEKYPKDKLVIDIKNEYIESIKNSLENDTYGYEAQGAACVLIMQDYNRAEKEGVLELFLKVDFYYHQIKVIIFLINENPLLLSKHFKHILKANSYQHLTTQFFGKLCSKYTHLEIPQQICKLCHDVINNEEENDNLKIKTAIIVLSILNTPQEFLKFSLPYFPTDLMPDLKDDINKTLYIKQQTIAGHFRNLISLSKVLEGILQFCKGDYLKFAQKSIELASVDVVENNLRPFFNALQERAVSVRKHAIFLSSRVLNKTQADLIFMNFLQKEKNSSVRKVLFKTVFHNFLNDANDHFWSITKQLMESADFSDSEMFEILTTCRQVPLEYLDKYIDFSWNIIQKCTSTKQTIEDGQVRLLNLINQANISTLSTEFCKTLIEQHFFKCERLTDLQRAIQSFTCIYVIYGPGSEEERLQTIIAILKNYKSNNWNNIKTMPLMYKLHHNFIKQLCDLVIDKKCTNRTILQKFLSKWEDVFQPAESFDEFVYLQLTSLYLTALEKRLKIGEIGEKIAAICDILDKKDCFLASCFSACLSAFLDHFYNLEFIGKSDENEIVLIENIVNNRSSFVLLELAADLLPLSIPIAPKIRQKYDSIVNTISNESNHKVQVIFRTYLRNTIMPNL